METSDINIHINPPQSNQESSPRLTTLHTRTNETTPDHLHRLEFKLHKQKLEPKRHGMNQNPDPNPARPVFQTPSPSTIARPVDMVVVRYRECLKNHAASMGTHVLDGCGEFMPSGKDDTPEALICAACECHRSFHRREVEGESQSGYHTHNPTPRIAAVNIPQAPSSQKQQHRYPHHHPMPHMMMAFGGGGAESSSEDLNIFRASKKRFRTKFTQEQKDKMYDFAERIDWRIRKQNEQEVLRFCNHVGLRKQVFKVWMHNNKQATKKNELYD